MKSVLLLCTAVLLQVLVLASGIYIGEVAASHHLHAEAVQEAKTGEQKWLKFQQDLIDQYQKDHPDSHPETPDFGHEGQPGYQDQGGDRGHADGWDKPDGNI